MILKKEIEKVVDWSKVDKEEYLLAMEISPIKDATSAVKTKGTVVMVGMGVSQFELNTITMITNQVILIGSNGSIPEDVAGVYEYFKKGLDPELIPIPFEEIDKGLNKLKEGKIRGRLVAEINMRGDLNERKN